MRFTQNLGRVLSGIAVAAGAAAVAELARPDVVPQLVPPEYAAVAVIGLQALQSILAELAFDRNWDGSSAKYPAPPKPEI